MPDLAALQWLRPWWLLALVPVALLLVALARRRSAASAWQRVIDPQLLEHLLQPAALERSRAMFIVAAAAWLLTVIALAGPSWSRAPQPVRQREDALVILLDLSFSMYATDVAPSRLIRAQHAISDVLARRKDGRTALIVYAGDAHVVTPLTDDVRTIANLLPRLEPAIMPIPGSNIGDALAVARQLLGNAQVQRARILVITDEIANPDDVSANARPTTPIAVLGVGTAAGAAIPLAAVGRPEEYLKDDQGNAIIARLDAAQLAAAARLGGGRYRTAGAAPDDANALLDEAVAADESAPPNRRFDVWSDQGYWLLLVVAPFAALAFRRGAIVSLALFTMLLASPRPALALTWRDVWQTRDQQAVSLLHEGAPARAATVFTTAAWRATALYRARQYAQAAQLFAADTSAQGYYNRGTALARAGDIAGAVKALDSALALQPRHADAAFNRDLLKRQQQRQQQFQPQARQPQSGTQQRDGGARAPDQSATPGQPHNNPPTPTQRAAGQSLHSQTRAPDANSARQGERATAQQDAQQRSLRAAQAQAEERQRATEQWLRRVPDDPGGLLQRKFTSESSARFLDHRAPPAQEKVW